jgi:hypothetical protein
MMAEFDYFFEFDSASAAQVDSIVGPLFSGFNFRQNIWAFDLASNFPVIPPGKQPVSYWCMAGKTLDDPVLHSHPRLKFFLVLPATVLYQNQGNSGFTAAPRDRAIYAKNWSFGFPEVVIPPAPASFEIQGNVIYYHAGRPPHLRIGTG